MPPDERLNGFSHLRSIFLNNQEVIFIKDGKLDLGKWQSIFYIETDLGKENRALDIAIIS